MFCRRAWQRVGPLARRAFKPKPTNAAPVRYMAFGVPGGSTNMAYFVLCGGGLTAAVVYAYKTVSGDSERYEDRLSNMGSTAKAPEAAAPVREAAEPEAEAAEPEAEAAEPEAEAAEPEAAPTTEVVAESVTAAAEPVAETAAEPVVEAVSEEEAAAPASEVVATEAEGEPAVAEEAAPAAVVEEVLEATPVSVEVAATEETPAEVPAAESAGTAAVDEAPLAEAEPVSAVPEAEATPAAELAASHLYSDIRSGWNVLIFYISISQPLLPVSSYLSESLPDMLTAVKVLTGSTVEIAAASVCETSLVKAVRKIEGDGKGLDSTLEVGEPEVQEATAEVVAKEAAEEATVVNEEEVTSAEAGADAEDTEAPGPEDLIKEETSSSVVAEEEAAAPRSEEPATSAPTVEVVGEVEAEDQAPVPGAAPEDETEASLEDAAPAEETTPAEEDVTSAEAAPVDETSPDETTPAAETSVEEAAAEASAVDAVEAVAVVDATQLAAASSASDLELLSAAAPESTSEAPVQEAKHCHSCHPAPSAAEEVAPPAALGGQLASEVHEAKEAELLVEGQKPKVSIWTVKSCSVM
ncbi:dextranase-like [Micropterus dolomieu]|uniref:dextranase-like n=1 Tax=Micropterus dolomieu TaxID=147949 RepID=UPI001E8E460C|nr:dextranase-like [Micropterus dolomieu]